MTFDHKYRSSVICPTCFIRRGTQNTNSKEHCMCIKEKQNISSQSFFRNLSHFYTPFRYLWKYLTKRFGEYLLKNCNICLTSFPCLFYRDTSTSMWRLTKATSGGTGVLFLRLQVSFISYNKTLLHLQTYQSFAYT